jgi:hypothetical protein
MKKDHKELIELMKPLVDFLSKNSKRDTIPEEDRLAYQLYEMLSLGSNIVLHNSENVSPSSVVKALCIFISYMKSSLADNHVPKEGQLMFLEAIKSHVIQLIEEENPNAKEIQDPIH